MAPDVGVYSFLMLRNQFEPKTWSCHSPERHTAALGGDLQHELQQLGVDTPIVDIVFLVFFSVTFRHGKILPYNTYWSP